ncbi:UNVERIFIED_CONTAM: hypothetical protein K2H54_001924 [Gekko kuhli]
MDRSLLYCESLRPDDQSGWKLHRQLVVLVQHHLRLVSLAHDHSGSCAGMRRTRDRLRQQFYWEGMGKDTARFVQSCEVCQTMGKALEKELTEEFGSPEDMCRGSTCTGGVEELTYSPLLSKVQRKEAGRLCGEFKDPFSSQAGHSAIAKHSIFMGDELPVAERARRVPRTQHQAVEKELEEMLAAGIVRPS